MSRKLRVLLSIGLVIILAGFISLPITGVIAAIGFFGYTCAPSVQVAGESSSLQTGSVSEVYFKGSPKQATDMKIIAAMIIAIGKERKQSNQSIAIAIATAIQESNLTNLPFLGAKNDHNSIGLFQQQPSPEWGTAEEIKDPAHAINAFYAALEKVPDRDTRPMIDVAIQVQRPSRSAYYSRWKWDDIAKEIVAQNAGAPSACASRDVSGAWLSPLDSKNYTISDQYGMRYHPIRHIWRMHTGVDMAAPEKTPIYAVHSGVISMAQQNGSFGNYISIKHEGGVSTDYGHLLAFATGITAGARVNTGDVIGFVGSTGGSTGNHLHFQVEMDGKTIDPVIYMQSVGVTIK